MPGSRECAAYDAAMDESLGAAAPRVEFSLTREEFIAGRQRARANCPSCWVALTCVVAAAIGIGALWSAWWVPGGAFVGVGFSLARGFGGMYDRSPAIRAPRTLVAGDSGLFEDWGTGSAPIPWRRFSKMLEYPDMLVLYYRGTCA